MISGFRGSPKICCAIQMLALVSKKTTFLAVINYFRRLQPTEQKLTGPFQRVRGGLAQHTSGDPALKLKRLSSQWSSLTCTAYLRGSSTETELFEWNPHDDRLAQHTSGDPALKRPPITPRIEARILAQHTSGDPALKPDSMSLMSFCSSLHSIPQGIQH